MNTFRVIADSPRISLTSNLMIAGITVDTCVSIPADITLPCITDLPFFLSDPPFPAFVDPIADGEKM